MILYNIFKISTDNIKLNTNDIVLPNFIFDSNVVVSPFVMYLYSNMLHTASMKIIE